MFRGGSDEDEGAWAVRGGGGTSSRRTMILGKNRRVYTDAMGQKYVNVSKTTLEEYLKRLEENGKAPFKKKSSSKKKSRKSSSKKKSRKPSSLVRKSHPRKIKK